MIRINLLPWARRADKAQRQHLGVLGAMVAVLGCSSSSGSPHDRGLTSAQSERNDYLKKENARLDKKSRRSRSSGVKSLRLLCAQADHRAALQPIAAQAVYLLQELVQQVPDGVY